MTLFLHVTIDVKEPQEADFVYAMKDFLDGGFLRDKHDWELTAGFKIRETDCKVKEDGTAQKDGGSKPSNPRFVNIWKLPTAFASNDVATIMLQSSELKSYVKLDSFVTTEKQNVVYRVNDPFTAGDIPLPKPGGTFALVRHYIARPNLAEFVFSTGSLASQWEREMAKGGRQFQGTFQNITGLLNEFWDVWYLPEPAPLDEFRGQLTKLIGGPGDLTASLRAALEFSDYGVDDGLLMVEPARYWQPK